MTPPRPRLLAFDTATELCSAALQSGAETLEYEEEVGREAGGRILQMIDDLLRAAGIGLGDLDAIAFGRGPGGFTGVRLAASIAQGLAFGAERRVIPVSDLQALAERGFALTPTASRMLVCNDARMREVYWAEYRRAADGSLEALTEERVGPPESVELDADARDGDALTGTVAGIGRGFHVYPSLAERLGSRLVAIHDRPLPRAREILLIAEREWRAGRTRAPADALPVYVRDQVAKPRAI